MGRISSCSLPTDTLSAGLDRRLVEETVLAAITPIDRFAGEQWLLLRLDANTVGWAAVVAMNELSGLQLTSSVCWEEENWVAF